MHDPVPADDDFCGNCSCSLKHIKSCNKIYKVDILTYLPSLEDPTLVSCDSETISVYKALRDLFSFHLYESCYNVDCVDVDIPLCLPCSLILQDMYKSFKLFKNLSKATSYISKITDKIQAIFSPPVPEKVSTTANTPTKEAEYKPNSSSKLRTSVQSSSSSYVPSKRNYHSFQNSTAVSAKLGAGATTAVTTNPIQDNSASDNELLSSTIKIERDNEDFVQNEDDIRIHEEMIDAAIRDIAAEEIDEVASARGGIISPESAATDSIIYISDDSNEDEESGNESESSETLNGNANKKKRRRRAPAAKIRWVVKETFPDEQTAVAYMFPDWKISYKNQATNGNRDITYYCSKHGKSCKARAKIIIQKSRIGSDIIIKYCEAENLPHTERDETLEGAAGLSREQKRIIKELQEQGVTKPREILEEIRERKLTAVPDKKKLSNYLRYVKTHGPDAVKKIPSSPKVKSESSSSVENTGKRRPGRPKGSFKRVHLDIGHTVGTLTPTTTTDTQVILNQMPSQIS